MEVAKDKKLRLDIGMESNAFSIVLFLILTLLIHLKLAGIVISEGALFSGELVGSSLGRMAFNSDIGFTNLSSVLLTTNMPLTSMMLIPVAIITTFIICVVFALITQALMKNKNKES